MKLEIWPNTNWSAASMVVMDRGYTLPRSWLVQSRIYFDWQPVEEILT